MQMTIQPTSPPSSSSKRNAASLLREYYGLSSQTPSSSQSPPDPTNPDNHAFDKSQYLNHLLATSSLSQLLSKESQLISEIRQLDGERQSLVYNHHHELVAASDTIRNIKSKSESLDKSLKALKTSFDTMSTLSHHLEILYHPVDKPFSSSHQQQTLDVYSDLQPIVTLPFILTDLIGRGETDGDGLAQAERLWGIMESVLSVWTDTGVLGVREIANECRTILKLSRKSVAVTNNNTHSLV